MNALVVYVGKSSLENYDHGLRNGIWGFRPNKTPKEPLTTGDIIIFGRGFSGGSPRQSADAWASSMIEELSWARIREPIIRETEMEWPDEKREGKVIYPYRLKFEDLHRGNEQVSLSGNPPLTRKVVEALRLSAISSAGKVCSVAKWPLGNEFPLPPGPPKPPPIKQMTPSTENLMTEYVNFAASRGYTFADQIFARFYASIRSKPFAILAGNSGTGKSRLVRLFAEASGATVTNGRFTMIPVRPDWNDSSELLGFFDLSGNYVPGQLTSPLLLAHQNPDKPFFVCLDEMNLARVEHYFSDFLSIIESRHKEGDRVVTDPVMHTAQLDKLKLESLPAAAAEAARNLQRSGAALGFPENLYIAGTVNMDETTQPFSRKVLDRANTIEFNDIDLLHGIDEESSAADVSPMDLSQSTFRPKFIMLGDMLPEHRDTARRIARFITTLNRELSKAGFEVGYRVRDEAIAFAFFADQAGLGEDEIHEAIVLQKILPRIQGSSNRVGDLLSKLMIKLKGESEVPDMSDPEVDLRLSELRSDPEASAVVRKLAGMLLLFREENFTSFWLA